MSTAQPGSHDHPPGIVVVGASLAGLRVVEGLRKEGYDGNLALIGDESHLPYDRPPLSKQLLSGEWEHSRIALTTAERLAAADVDLHLGRPAVAVDADAVHLSDGSTVRYDRLVVATGARARTWPGQDRSERIHYLRTLDDALDLRRGLTAAPGASLIVIGGGFVGLEVAAVASGGGHQVTIVEAAETPLARVVSPAVGSCFARLHAQAGVALHCGTAVSEIETNADGVAVHLDDGRQLTADRAVIGVGSVPNVEWLGGLGLDADRGVPCDHRGRAAERVWAVGDVARWTDPTFGDLVRHEHWTSATDQASVVVADLLGQDAARPHQLPYFWSHQYDVNFQLAGRPDLADSVGVLEQPGSGEDRGTVFGYTRGERLVAIAAFHQPGRFMKLRRALQLEINSGVRQPAARLVP